GHALEDLAWLCGEKDLYEEAVTAFTKSIDLREQDPGPWIGRGRTNWKRYKQHGGKNHLEAAAEDLKEGLQRADKKRDADKQTEARLWLAELTLRKGGGKKRYSEAVALLTEAIKLAPDLWLGLALDTVVEEMNVAIKIGTNNAGVAALLYQAVQSQCKQL